MSAVPRKLLVSMVVTVLGVAAQMLDCERCAGDQPPSPPDANANSTPDPQQRLLLLTNGNIVRGRVTMDGDRYVVTTERSEMRIPADAVEHVCRSLAEAYQFKRAQLVAAAVPQRPRLIAWCLSHGLLDEAEAELREAQQADGNNPRYELLARRLKLARQPMQPAPPPAPPEEPAVSDARLNVLVRTMPGPAVEAFTQTVQPLLLKNCAAAGCHGPAPRSEFQLIRLARGITPSRKVTQRNLYAALSWIDREHPEKSRLLTAAAQAHGNTPHNKFDGTDGAVFRHLTQWVHQVAATTEASRPESMAPADATLSQSAPASSLRQASAGIRTVADQRPLNNVRGNDGPIIHAPGPVQEYPPRPSGPINAPSAPGSEPADPFDPEAFNRRYHRDEK